MKKFLSILLTAMMVASVFVVPANAFVPEREVFSFVQDFSDESKTDFTRGHGVEGVVNAAEVSDGKAVFTPNPKNNAMALNSDVMVDATTYTVEFDISTNIDLGDFSVANGGYAIFFGTKKGSNPYAVEIYPSGMKANTVRTYRFTVDTTFDAVANDTARGFATVQKKDAGESAFSEVPYHAACDRSAFRAYFANYSGTSYAYNQLFLSPDNQFTLGAREMNGKAPFEGELVITVDNISITAIGDNYTVKSGIKYTNDAEEAFENGIAASSISYTQASEGGNGYYVLKPLADNAQQVALAMDNYLDYGQTLTFDLRSDNAASKSLKVLGFNATRDARIVNILINGLTANKWYSYKIEIGNSSNDIVVYRKDRGAADSTYVVIPENSGWEKDSVGIGSFKGLYLGFRTFNGQYANTQYSIDNIQVRDTIAYSGNLSKTDAELYIDTPENNETVFMASYDGSRLVDVDFETLDGGDNKAELSVAEGTAATKIFVWNLAEDGTTDIIMSPIEIQ